MKPTLLIIDVQDKSNPNYQKCIDFAKEHQLHYGAIYATIFSTTEKPNMFHKKLCYHKCDNVDITLIESDYNGLDIHFITKDTYTANILKYLNPDKTKRIDIIGCDSDACIMATAFYLWDNNIDFNILSEYVYTDNKEVSNETIIKLLKRQFGPNII